MTFATERDENEVKRPVFEYICSVEEMMGVITAAGEGEKGSE